MDFELDEEVIMIRDMMRRFVQKDAQPLEMPLFNQGELTQEQEEGLKEKIVEQMGLWAVTVPEDYGGDDLDLLSTCLIEEELGQTFVPVDYGDISPILFGCNDDQMETYLEPAVEGDLRPVLALREAGRMSPDTWQTSAVRDGEDLILRGHKLLGRKPRDDDFYVVFARMDEGVTAFLVDAETDGVRLNGKPELTLDDCILSEEAVLGDVGGAFELGVDRLPHQAVKMGARYLGMAQRLLDMSALYAKDWVSMGQPLALRPAIMRMVAEMAADVHAARYMVYHAAWQLDEEEEARHEALMVRLFTGQMIRKAIDKTIMVHGGTSYLEQAPAIRMYRNLVPDESLEIGLENSRMAVAEHYLELQTLMAED